MSFLSSEYVVEAVNGDGGAGQVGEGEGGEVVRDRLQLEHGVLRPRREQPRVARTEELRRLCVRYLSHSISEYLDLS